MKYRVIRNVKCYEAWNSGSLILNVTLYNNQFLTKSLNSQNHGHSLIKMSNIIYNILEPSIFSLGGNI